MCCVLQVFHGDPWEPALFPRRRPLGHHRSQVCVCVVGREGWIWSRQASWPRVTSCSPRQRRMYTHNRWSHWLRLSEHWPRSEHFPCTEQLVCEIPSTGRREQRTDALGRGGKQHTSSPGMPGLAGASPQNGGSDDLCGEGQETSLETSSIDFPKAPLCSVAGVLSTLGEWGCPGDNKSLLPKGHPKRNAEHDRQACHPEGEVHP